uniref:Disease resistance protein RPM1 n=2 Tax=Cajanus cajan TaxID=3821 RepID=A0A151QNZ9_CAJCA|nr:Disease resistance protein RPM1 [Cajanus cajan]
MLRDLPKEVADITEELESFQDFINDADQVAEAEEDDGRRDRIKKRVMRLREAAFRMEDIIDEFSIHDENNPHDPRCAALLCEAVEFIKTRILQLQVAYKIQDVKSLVCAERDGFQKQFPLPTKPSGSRGNQNVTWHKLRMDPLFIEQDEVVGFESPRRTLNNWLIEGREERTVISVVGLAGVGKTTLAKQVFDNVHNNFECHALITVSQSYTVEGLLRDMLHQFCKEKMENHPADVSTMDRRSLIEEVRKQLRNKRYVVMFDDVWNEKFWNDVEFAGIDNKNKSRILITTRYEKVAHFCKKSSFIEVHKLEEPLSEEECFRLFCNKAFKYGFDGRCPEELKDISLEIVRKCKGLPLAIVAIGGLLSQKDFCAHEWILFSQNLSLELERNSELNSIGKILSLSYYDLPYNLRLCLLYFGMYPEDYEVKSSRLIRQWVAEGFVKRETGKILEEVARQELSRLILRSLVQVSSFSIDGKVKRCRVHDLIHDMILRKAKETGFCQYFGVYNESVSSGIVRRLIITVDSNDLVGIERSHIRSILIFRKEKLTEQFMDKMFSKYMSLRVLDFENAGLLNVPNALGNLIHLKYLSFRNSWIQSLPKSIGKLKNLEILDVRRTMVFDIPKEISKIRKLRHLLGEEISFIAMKECLGSMTFLEKIRVLKVDPEGVVIRELGKLKQLRNLRITNFTAKLTNTLCSSIHEMQYLEVLHIHVGHENEVIDFPLMSSLSTLRKLFLNGKLESFPNWISHLQNLVKLSLNNSKLTNDPLESLKGMPNLLFVSISHYAYVGETLYFEDGGFRKLKDLELKYLNKLNYIFIERGALQTLKKLGLKKIPQLRKVPSGIQHLEKLEVLHIEDMPSVFEHSIAEDGGQDHWMIRHVPRVQIKNSYFESVARAMGIDSSPLTSLNNQLYGRIQVKFF